MAERPMGRDISTIPAMSVGRNPTWEERRLAAQRVGLDPSNAPVHPEQLERFLTGQEPMKPVAIVEGDQRTVVYRAVSGREQS